MLYETETAYLSYLSVYREYYTLEKQKLKKNEIASELKEIYKVTKSNILKVGNASIAGS